MTRTNTRAQQRNNKNILATSDLCHICGHPGADAVDHVIPLARGGDDSPANKRPAHHDVPCETCGHRCNREKGARLVPPVTRRSGSLMR
jgi:5-methylcytosine-specific restriction endonuclease McrA